MLKVVINGGTFKQRELLASSVSVDGQLSIHHNIYNRSESLPLNWVFLKHPNLRCDNGLLVVIEGEHCGKYVQQIHHGYENGEIIMILAVVKRTEGAADSLTREQLKLDASHLCVGSEIKDEKSLNDSLMSALHEQACKTHAK